MHPCIVDGAPTLKRSYTLPNYRVGSPDTTRWSQVNPSADDRGREERFNAFWRLSNSAKNKARSRALSERKIEGGDGRSGGKWTRGRKEQFKRGGDIRQDFSRQQGFLTLILTSNFIWSRLNLLYGVYACKSLSKLLKKLLAQSLKAPG